LTLEQQHACGQLTRPAADREMQVLKQSPL
jgi:hypothetical protein